MDAIQLAASIQELAECHLPRCSGECRECVYLAYTKQRNAKDARIKELEAREPFAKFGEAIAGFLMAQDAWFGEEWSDDIMPLAVEAGLAERAPYDPMEHGQDIEAEPGDEIWVWNQPQGEVK